jgi:hypothetical protein
LRSGGGVELDELTRRAAAHHLLGTPPRVRQLLGEWRIAHIHTPLGRLHDPADVTPLAAQRRAARDSEPVPLTSPTR